MLPFDPEKLAYSFRAKCPHAWRRVHLFEDEEMICLLFRPKNAPQEWLGALFQASYHLTKKQLWRRGRRRESEYRRQIEGNLFFRVFHLADPRENEQRIWRILWRPDFAYAIPLGHPKNYGGNFGVFFWPQKFHSNVSLWGTPTIVLQQHFGREWQDTNSDVRSVLSWCDLSEMERRWRSIKWLCGGRQELDLVLRAAYLTESEWPKDEILQILWFFTEEETKPTSFAAFQRKQGGVIRWDLSPGHRISRLAERLGERNQGIVNRPEGSRLDWNRNWKKDASIGSAYSRTNMMFKIEPPTQHDRMEASLLLRDWLRENAPDLMADWFLGTV